MNAEKTKRLLDHFKKDGINHNPGTGLNRVLLYQDEIGHSSIAEIREFEKTLSPEERKTFIWANFSTLSQDTAIDIYNKTIAYRWLDTQTTRIEEELSEQWEKLYERERQLREAKRAIFRKIRKIGYDRESLRIQNDRLRAQNKELIDSNKKHRALNKALAAKAEKFNTLVNLIKEA